MSEIDARRDHYGVDESIRGTLGELGALVEPEIAALSHAHVRQGSKVPSVFKRLQDNAAKVAALTDTYTRRLFADAYSSDGMSAVEARVVAEREMGFDARHRVSVTRFMMSAMFRRIARRHPFSGRKAMKAADAAMRLFLFDVANAIVVHARLQEEEARARGERRDDALRRFDATVADLRQQALDLAGTLGSASDRLDGLVKAATQQSATAIEAAESAFANATRTAGATTHLAASTEAIADQVARSVELSRGAVADVRQTSATSRELAEAVSAIGAVVKLISSIAGQTNLLALNATIEAARAGDAGRGFAVVAGEVKALAGQTARATGEIGRQIALIEAATGRSLQDGGRVGAAVDEIASSSAVIAVEIRQQSAATDSIAAMAASSAELGRVAGDALGAVNAVIGNTETVLREVLDLSRSLAVRTGELDSAMSDLFQQVKAA